MLSKWQLLLQLYQQTYTLSIITIDWYRCNSQAKWLISSLIKVLAIIMSRELTKSWNIGIKYHTRQWALSRKDYIQQLGISMSLRQTHLDNETSWWIFLLRQPLHSMPSFHSVGWNCKWGGQSQVGRSILDPSLFFHLSSQGNHKFIAIADYPSVTDSDNRVNIIFTYTWNCLWTEVSMVLVFCKHLILV